MLGQRPRLAPVAGLDKVSKTASGEFSKIAEKALNCRIVPTALYNFAEGNLGNAGGTILLFRAFSAILADY
jgi:hypothetical protein